MRFWKLLLAGVFTAAVSGTCPALAVEPVKIRIGWVVPITDWALLMLEKSELAQLLGKSYILEPVRFASSPLVITAMANGELDIGNLAFSTLVLTARRPFLDQHREGIIDFLEEDLRIARWYLNPKNHDAAVAIAAKLTKQPKERFAPWLFTERDYYRDPNMVPNLRALQANIDVQRESGFLREPLEIRKYAELGLVEEAATRLK